MTTLQSHELVSAQIREEFLRKKRDEPDRFERRLTLSWSNWGFGAESLEITADRLVRAGIDHIELHGNRYGPSLGYRASVVNSILEHHGLSVSGVCGMYSTDNDFASVIPSSRQRAIDYTRMQIELTREVGGSYLLVVPGAVGRPRPYDGAEQRRSVDGLRRVSEDFVATGVRAAIEPIRRDEVSLVHSVSDAVSLIDAINSPGIQHINGDIFHMQASEPHIGAAIRQAGDRLINLHMADSNRGALGSGSMDIDTIIRALYLNGHNVNGRFVTPEPLGPGASPYDAIWSSPVAAELDELVLSSTRYFREREEAVLAE